MTAGTGTGMLDGLTVIELAVDPSEVVQLSSSL